MILIGMTTAELLIWILTNFTHKAGTFVIYNLGQLLGKKKKYVGVTLKTPFREKQLISPGKYKCTNERSSFVIAE